MELDCFGLIQVTRKALETMKPCALVYAPLCSPNSRKAGFLGVDRVAFFCYHSTASKQRRDRKALSWIYKYYSVSQV